MTTYRIDVAGTLPQSARTWLGDLGVREIARSASTSTMIVGDQAALVGVVNRLHGLGIVIEQITRPGHVAASTISGR